MSAESGDGYPLVLHSEADPSRLGGTAVCGFSTVGSEMCIRDRFILLDM